MWDKEKLLKEIDEFFDNLTDDEFDKLLEKAGFTVELGTGEIIIKSSENRPGEIKRGDKVGEAFSGTIGIIADIQYVHDRYQLEHTSGWRYGIENIAKLN